MNYVAWIQKSLNHEVIVVSEDTVLLLGYHKVIGIVSLDLVMLLGYRSH